MKLHAILDINKKAAIPSIVSTASIEKNHKTMWFVKCAILLESVHTVWVWFRKLCSSSAVKMECIIGIIKKNKRDTL